ncbi:MAG TPA: imidazole glycerol phosphate synthase subunit HisH [Flavipsychrobacter sp.]|nr:imidazole glycerol phosphate synthase subunit HisH [Flavipsychrobacter sp.]
MITIADYGTGNLASIQNMLKRINVDSITSSDFDIISKAERLILPGVGAFDTCAGRLRETGILPLLEQKVLHEKVPVLGICVGMQLMLSGSEEGLATGLNWIPGKVQKFDATRLPASFKIPHMGWTEVKEKKQTSLLADMHDTPRFYFVHSYHAVPENTEHTLMAADYGYEFAAAIQKDNIVGVQFHPEKSHRFGMKLLENFVKNF